MCQSAHCNAKRVPLDCSKGTHSHDVDRGHACERRDALAFLPNARLDTVAALRMLDDVHAFLEM